MVYYTDPLHFTLATGDLIIQRVYNDPGARQDFGERITAADVNAYLDRMQAKRLALGTIETTGSPEP